MRVRLCESASVEICRDLSRTKLTTEHGVAGEANEILKYAEAGDYTLLRRVIGLWLRRAIGTWLRRVIGTWLRRVIGAWVRRVIGAWLRRVIDGD